MKKTNKNVLHITDDRPEDKKTVHVELTAEQYKAFVAEQEGKQKKRERWAARRQAAWNLVTFQWIYTMLAWFGGLFMGLRGEFLGSCDLVTNYLKPLKKFTEDKRVRCFWALFSMIFGGLTVFYWEPIFLGFYVTLLTLAVFVPAWLQIAAVTTAPFLMAWNRFARFCTYLKHLLPSKRSARTKEKDKSAVSAG